MDEQEPIKPTNPPVKIDPNINFFGLTNYRNHNRRFGIKIDDRRRHMYIVGKTGMGKTTILENMVLNDIYSGHGVGLVDPHGDFAEKIIDFVPANRINDIVYFNPSDIDYPIGFNILETTNPEQKHLVASGLMGVFKKIWPDVWSARMEYILNNTILALLDFPGTTLLGINRMLADAEYRKRVVSNTKDPVIKAYWQTEFANYTDKFRSEAVSPIQNKIGQFLSASVIRNIVAQVKSRINIREIMDTKKILIMNLSKGRIGEDNSRLLGGMLITRIQLAAMERVDIPEAMRSDFFLYVDEFQNFATESFANILSEARKYRLDLIMAHQYMEQLDELVLASVIGNVGTMVTFRVGSSDAEILAKEFAPTFVEEDLVNLPKYHTYLKLMIDGVASRPFSALTLPPIGSSTQSTEKVVRVSRERYAVNRDKIEDKIARWSGMIIMPEDEARELEMDEDEVKFPVPPGEKVGVTAIPAKPPVTETPAAPALVSLQPKSRQVQPVVTALVAAQPAVSGSTQPPRPATAAPQPALPRPPTPQVSKPPQNNNSRPVGNNNRPDSRSPISGGSRPPSSGGGGSNPGRNAGGGGSDQRDRNRKKKNRSSLPPSTAASVLLGDPAQKGISLSSMLPKEPVVPSVPPPLPAVQPRSVSVPQAPRLLPPPQPGFSEPPPLDIFAMEEPTAPAATLSTPATIPTVDKRPDSVVPLSPAPLPVIPPPSRPSQLSTLPVPAPVLLAAAAPTPPTVVKPGAIVTFDDTTLD